MSDNQADRDLPAILWIALPLISVAISLLTPLLGYHRWKAFMLGEGGFVEAATAVFLIPAVVLGVMIFLRRRQLPKGVGWMLLLGALAAFYFAGEEISWGQHVIGFETPESWATVNDQNEFNLHNWHNLCNNTPRQLLLVGIIVGGVIIPLIGLWRSSGGEVKKDFWYWIAPTARLIPVSVLAAFSTVPEKVVKEFGVLKSMPEDSYFHMALIARAGEVKEYWFALVICLYMISIYMRFVSSSKRQAQLQAQ